MLHLDYSNQGRRPTAAQIVAAWERAGKPNTVIVEYGETFAEFRLLGSGRWDDSGNGCRGVDRSAVVRALQAKSPVPARGLNLW